MNRRLPIFVVTVLAALLSWAAIAAPRVTTLRLAGQPDKTRVVLELSETIQQKVFTLDNPTRVVIDLPAATLTGRLPSGEGLVKTLRAAKRDNGDLRVVLDTSEAVVPRVTWLAAEAGSGYRLVIDLPTSNSAAPSNEILPAPMAEPPTSVVAPAVPTASSTESVMAALPVAVKSITARGAARDLIIAIDAGHGGDDPGAIGRRGTKEKTVTLAIAKLLKERIDAEPGMRAVLTRDGDFFVPLRERTARARQQQADMFVSIHADAVANAGPSGSSVYTLSSKRATSEAARYLADRENAADLVGGVSLDDKSGVLASVLLDLTQGASMSASMDAAGHVLKQLDRIGNVHHMQVQQASFMVLTSPDIPSMLVETAFISNPIEEQRLADPRHQARIADALLGGVRDYFYTNSPPGTRVAQLKQTRQARN
ncbi:MAG: N-acetylmuramoyl-L-alanine amidase [Steroidobacteraceae bacterium]